MSSDPTRTSFEAVMRAGQAAEPTRTQRLLAWLAYYGVFATLTFALGFWAIEQLAISPFVVLGLAGVALFIARLFKRWFTATPFRIGLVVGAAMPVLAMALLVPAGALPGAPQDPGAPTAPWRAPLQKLKRLRAADPGDSHIVFSAAGDDAQVVVGFTRCVDALHHPTPHHGSLHKQARARLERHAPDFAARDALQVLVIHVCQRFDAGDLDALHSALDHELDQAEELLKSNQSRQATCAPGASLSAPSPLSLSAAALCQLPADQARALRLHTEGHDPDAIAPLLHISPAAAARQIKQGRLNLEDEAHRLARVHGAF
ncbi:sigma-70 family RNA polymerase sigma factor [Lujinxingia litoralis]|nr:sigma-70 family RNA polymerase sigma factor [Lujinxingia litoralis]